jgi:hypothetical protein
MNKATQFSAPGNYIIEVRGHVQSDWANRFGSLQVITPPAKQGEAITFLQGIVNDQAELAGILNTLYELHMPLLSVQYLED